MKELTKYSRLAGYLEKLFDKLNDHFFDNALERPVITIQSSARSYGHYTLYNAWDVKGVGRREINIAAGTLDRPIENTIATLLHEMCHQYNNEVLNVQDCSRGGTYHNKHFKATAESHGLIVTRTDKYGWSTTQPGEDLLDWILENDIQDIKLNRNEYYGVQIVGGKGNSAANGGAVPPVPPTKTNHNHRYVCPKCGAIARSTKAINLICGDCMVKMDET